MLVRGDELVTALRQRRRIKFRLELNFLSPACPTSTRNTPSLPHLYSNLVPHGPRPCVASRLAFLSSQGVGLYRLRSGFRRSGL